MPDKPENPYAGEIDPDQRILIGRNACWLVIALFLIFILTPPIYRNIREAAKGEDGWVPTSGFFNYNPADPNTPTIAHHLRAVETKIDDADFRVPPRRTIQSALTRFLAEGNEKAFIGRDGWLFFRPAIKALTGYGPLKPEPPSPMKDPTIAGWNPALPAIASFAAQLQERGIDLVLVPVPVKSMIYPEMIDGKSHPGPLSHRDADAFYAQLRAAGADVLDLSDALWSSKNSGAQAFLKQDTHWTSDAMRLAARLVAEHIKAKPYFTGIPSGLSFDESTLTRSHYGDLVNILDIPGSKLFSPEPQTLTVITDPATGEPVADDPRSPITLLGDSFVNIFDDPSIGFGDPAWRTSDSAPSEPLIGAGFRRHLAKELGTRLDVIANNGGAASAVRQAFAEKPDNLVRSKKVVIWVIASRDLFLSESPARQASVRWDTVTFNPASADLDSPPPGGFIATATLVDKAPITDPVSVPYKESLFACLYKIDSIESGTYSESEVLVWQWAFRDKKLLPTSRFETGKQYRLVLSPWESQPALHTINKSNKPELEERFDLTPFFLEKGQPAP